MKPRALAVLALLLAACAPHLILMPAPPLPPVLSAHAAPPAPAPPAAREAVLAAIPAADELWTAAQAKHGWPGLAVGVVYQGKLVAARGFGVRSLDGKQPVDGDTVFRIGSVTKVLAGLGLLVLRDSNTLLLDEPLMLSLPEANAILYPSSDSPRVTLRHLVTHTSGIPRLGRLRYDQTDHELTEKDLLSALDGLKLEFSPGTRSSYSNLGMALLGLVLTKQSGQPFEAFLKAKLFDPLRMSSTFWHPEQVAPGRLATGYLRDGKPNPHPWRLGAGGTMGGLYSTVNDLARLVAFELGAWPPRDDPDEGPVKRSSVRESQLPAGGGPPGRRTFGINWMVVDDPELGHVAAHTGSTLDYSATVWLLPERGLGLVALANGGDPEALDETAHEVLRMLSAAAPRSEPQPTPPVAAAIAQLTKFLAEPSVDAARATFAGDFLKNLPPEKMVELSSQLRAAVGACRGARVVATESDRATLELACERGAVEVKLHVSETEAPRLDGCAIHPAVK